MTWIAPVVDRPPPLSIGDERTLLESWLDFHRQTLLVKCENLTAEQLKLRSAEPSALSLLGLVRHMAEVERSWFRRRFRGEDIGWVHCSDASPDGDFDDIETADAESDFATFNREVELACVAADGHDLDEMFHHSNRNEDMNLRWIYIHMIEEYARHNGHADIIRERIDGVVDD